MIPNKKFSSLIELSKLTTIFDNKENSKSSRIRELKIFISKELYWI
jgi:hypothetical protein